MIYILPISISIMIGYLGLRLILKNDPPKLPLLIFLGASAGLFASAFLVFTSLILWGKLFSAFVITAHTALLLALGWCVRKVFPDGKRLPLNEFEASDKLGLLLVAVITIPVIIHANFYPYGGWDAWSCWNLKARFIFLGGEGWKNMFDPLLWRSNIAYPFLVPAVNVWAWCFGTDPVNTVPLGVSCLITFITAGTLLFALKKITGRLHVLLAPLWLLSNVFFVKLASSQYSDLMVGNYFLAAIVSWIAFEKSKSRGWLCVMALMLGALSFTKSEGLVLSLITLGLAFMMRLLSKDKSGLTKGLWIFGAAAVVAFLPTIIFQITFSTNSHTFINGLGSADKPATLERLQAVLAFMGMELMSGKWNGFWLIALLGIALSRWKAWRKELLLIPLTLIAYLIVLGGVYWINTFFPIVWWLGNTLNRIIYALTPAVIFWVFLALE
ncbi:MAG: hypothetical protein HQL16_06555 [Candidatus Omnitrophica bacterium]|nr:hypothetical protein [Candidatus Omnitrophota bacterium]